MYNYTDYFEKYGRIMQFNKNKSIPFHRWYPFVEGYSKEFIQSITSEFDKNDIVCLEPFSGSGTTALELQKMGIQCYSFEVNPLMYLVAKTKLEKYYDIQKVVYWHDYICKNRKNKNIVLKSEFKTLYEENGKKKWNFSKEAGLGVEKLRITIESIDELIYRDLFMVALSAILLEVSNLYRNGKCLSYKKDWENIRITQEDVFRKFDNKVCNELMADIENFSISTLINNKETLFLGDSREYIEEKIADNSVDLVITSPPYLNSRDYTDTYMLEIKTLGFAHNNDEIKKIREKTLRSHVQIKWEDKTQLENTMLKNLLTRLEIAEKEKGTWNTSIIDMVRLYFVDMQNIFSTIYRKLKVGGKIFFNVSNSAYYNVMVNTLEICASIAETEGFAIEEIRKARYLNTSPQQQEIVGQLLEGVIVMRK